MFKAMVILAAVMSMPALAFPDTIYVPDDYATIQEAIDAAVNGDTVIVRVGTYYENIDFTGKAITLTSEQGAASTVIDGNQTGTVATFQSGEGADSVLNGFTVTNGRGSMGGGIYCVSSSSPTITNNIIHGNTAGFGGGIHCHDSSPVVTSNFIWRNTARFGGGIYCYSSSSTITCNVISGNLAENSGGGIRCAWESSLTITDNTITDNSAQLGGGIDCSYNYASLVTITNNTISGNTAVYYYGGGISLYGSQNAMIMDNTISENEAASLGGGISVWSLSHTLSITDNIISQNLAGRGGGIHCEQYSSPTITNNILSGNESASGGGIFCESTSSPIITNNTLSGNKAGSSGGGIRCEDSSSTIVRNTILWDNSAPVGPEISVAGTASLDIAYSDAMGGQVAAHVEPGSTFIWGPGMIDSDPLFVDPVNGDVHLTFDSPCKDSGDNLASGLPDYDFENDPRIVQGFVDMGADEFHRHLYYVGNTTPGGFVHLRIVDLPSTAPVWLWAGSGVMESPVSTPFGLWYLEPPILAFIDAGVIPSSGVMDWPHRLGPSTPSPVDIPMQALVGDGLTNLCVIEVR